MIALSESVKKRLMRKTGLKMTQMELLGWDVPDDVSEEVLIYDHIVRRRVMVSIIDLPLSSGYFCGS